ncbi:MAG: hypothetical protein ACYTAN_07495 [Planctomycetota bacterium]|jgi:hypothetical protein
MAIAVGFVAFFVVLRIASNLVEDEYKYFLRLRNVRNRLAKCRETQRKVFVEDMLYEQQAAVEQGESSE